MGILYFMRVNIVYVLDVDGLFKISFFVAYLFRVGT